MSFRSSLNRRGAVAAVVGIVVGATVLLSQAGSASAATKAIGNTSPECQGYKAFSSWDIKVDGKSIPHGKGRENLTDRTHAGDTVELFFKLGSNCDNVYVGLDSYTALSDHYVASEASKQKLFQRQADTYKADGSTHHLKVTLPDCYYQVDAYTSGQFKPGDYTLDNKFDRFLGGDNGGSKSCVASTTTVKPTTTTAKPTTTTTAKITTTTTTPVVVKPSASGKACSADGLGFTVSYANKGTSSQVFTSSANGKVLESGLSVAAGKTVTKDYTFAQIGLAAKATTQVVVKADTKQVASLDITNDCLEVSASVAPRCDTVAGSGAVITFNNPGKVDETFEVTRNGVAIDGSPVVVKAGETAKRSLLRMNEDETAVLKIVGVRSGLNVQKTVTLDCTQVEATTVVPTTAPPTTPVPPTTAAPQVLGEQITKPELAHTGTNVMPWMVLGTLLVGIGAALLGARRRIADVR